MSEHTFFVYVDYTLETPPRPFYVGKGNAKRVKCLYRNKKHAWVTKIYGLNRKIDCEVLIESEALDREKTLVKELDTFNPNFKDHSDIRCNHTLGGEGCSGYKFTNEQRQHVKNRLNEPKIKAKHVKKIKKAMTPEHCAKISKMLRLRYADKTAREKLSESCKVAHAKNPALGEHISEIMKAEWENPEIRARRTEINKRIWDDASLHKHASEERSERWKNQDYKKRVGNSLKAFYAEHPEKCIQIDQLTLTGEFVKSYPSLSEAVRQTGIGNITACCRGRRKNAGGFMWRYTNECSDVKQHDKITLDGVTQVCPIVD